MRRSLILLIIVVLLTACYPAASPPQPTAAPANISAVATTTLSPIPATVSITPTESPSPSVTPIVATIQALTHDARVQFGPKNQTLDLTMRGFNGYGTGKTFTDFVAEMRCYNPYGQSGTKKWAYGFVFRYTRADGFYRVTIDSDANWQLTQGVGTETNRVKPDQPLGQGTVSNFNVAANEHNDLQLVVHETDAVLLINGQYIATINGLTQVTKGDIAPAIIGKDGTLGRCENFTVKTFTNG